jgi:hypothetical protein
MVAPSGDGAIACMKQAMETVDAPIDYINTHGTSTPVGDMQEVRAMRELFGDQVPVLVHQVADRPLAGRDRCAGGDLLPDHAEQGLYRSSVNVETPDPLLGDMPLVTQTRDAELKTVLSNSFGFGGTNASLVLKRWEGSKRRSLWIASPLGLEVSGLFLSTTVSPMKIAILDRDGTLNQWGAQGFIGRPDEWVAVPSALEAVSRLNRAGWHVVVATNQPGWAAGCSM